MARREMKDYISPLQSIWPYIPTNYNLTDFQYEKRTRFDGLEYWVLTAEVSYQTIQSHLFYIAIVGVSRNKQEILMMKHSMEQYNGIHS